MESAVVRKSLLKTITWFGGDRSLVGAVSIFIFMIGITVIFGYGFVDGFFYLALLLGLELGLIWIASNMYQADPFMVKIVMRVLPRYRKYYAPHSDLGVPHPMIKDIKL